MEAKQMVLTGLFVTALITAFALSVPLANVVVAFIVLGAGLVITYYIAMNKKRIEQLGNFRKLIKSIEEIQQQVNVEAGLRQLVLWTRRLLKIEEALVWLPDEFIFGLENTQYHLLLEDIVQKIQVIKQPLEFSFSENRSVDWPEGIRWLAAYPLIIEGNLGGILILLNSQPCEINYQAEDTINILCRQGTTLISRWQAQESDKEEKQLMLKTLLAGMEAGDPVFMGHSERVYVISSLIAGKLGLNKEEMRALKYSALLHDIGKSAEAAIKEEDGANSDHASLGARLIPDSGIFKQVKEAVYYHHERYDGSGYPQGLSRTDIPFLARIIAVADVYDAITKLCSLEDRLDHKTAIAVIKKATGSLFDPLVVVALEEVAEELGRLFPVNPDTGEEAHQSQ
jgi:putative nucleotidyltransferase with HDIG domain